MAPAQDTCPAAGGTELASRPPWGSSRNFERPAPTGEQERPLGADQAQAQKWENALGWNQGHFEGLLQLPLKNHMPFACSICVVV